MSGGIRYIGPVAVDYRDPNVTWTSESINGIRSCSITGLVTWTQAQQLSELVNNPARRITVGGESGVLEYLDLDDFHIRSFKGWYLLQSFSGPEVEHRFSVQVDRMAGPVPFSLDAAYLGDGTHREVILARSSRDIVNGYVVEPRSLIVNPFWDETTAGGNFPVNPGGTRFTREYDSSSIYNVANPAPPTRNVVLHSGNGDFPSVVPLAPVKWTADRGGDVRAYDRTEGRHVYGPHAFASTTDILITNGIVRFWVGNRLVPAFLNVSVYRTGVWREVGSLLLAHQGSSDYLLAARLVSVTPEAAVVSLTVQNQGEVLVRLNRGERMLRIKHGTGTPQASRHVAWLGTPPYRVMSNVTNGTGQFSNGLVVNSGGAAQFWWPPEVPATEWVVNLRWLPTAASSTQASSGLLGFFASSGTEVASLSWDATSKALRWTANAVTLSSAALTFSAGAIIAIALRQTPTGRTLSVRVAGGAVAHTSDGAFDPGAPSYASIGIGQSGGTITGGAYGSGAYGSGAYGGSVVSGTSYANGVIDNVGILDKLTDAETVTLLSTAAAMGGLPNEGRLVWYAPFDSKPIPLGSAFADGRVYETTTDGGSTRAPDANGLTRAIAVLALGVSKRTGLALMADNTSHEFGAFLATTNAQDDLGDHHSQFSASNAQEVRVR